MHPWAVEFHLTQGEGKMRFEGIDTLKDTVVKSLLAQLVPQMFDRIESGQYGGSLSKRSLAGSCNDSL